MPFHNLTQEVLPLIALMSIVNTTTLHPPSLAMPSIVDSEAHFTKSMKEIGVTDRGKAATTTAGYTALGHLPFGVGQLGVPVPEQEFGRFAANVLGGMASMHDVSCLRRLLFESHTMVMAQLREQVANPGTYKEDVAGRT